jgi:hypothetical protein
MFFTAEAAKIQAEIAKLESARKDCHDSRILDVIEFRIEERRLKLRQIQSHPSSSHPRSPTPPRAAGPNRRHAG